MLIDEIKVADIDTVEKRFLEIRSMDIDGIKEISEITELSDELDALESRKKELKETSDAKKEFRNKILNGEIESAVIAKPVETKEERKMKFDIANYNSKEELRSAILASEEYRLAFNSFLRTGLKGLKEEQRALFTHTTQNTGVLLPTQVVDEIWDLVHESHCIIQDIDNRRTNVVISIKKHTTIVAGKAKQVAEGVANDDENNTFVEVNLAGKDYSKTVKLSYAEQKMTNLGEYIKKEIAADLAEILAKDIFAKIDTDTHTSNKYQSAGVKKLAWNDLTNGFSKIKSFGKGGERKIYVNEQTYYEYVCGATDADGKPLLGDTNGVNGLLKAQFKIDAAVPANKIYMGIPKQIVNNVVQDIMIETDKDIETHKHIYSGYARMECSLINDKAFAILDIKQA